MCFTHWMAFDRSDDRQAKIAIFRSNLQTKQPFTAKNSYDNTSEFTHKCVGFQKGFIPDLMRLVRKYNLETYIDNYVKHSIFPSRKAWASILKETIVKVEEINWLQRMSADDNFNFFRQIHRHIEPHKAWTVARNVPHLQAASKYVIDLCAIVRNEEEPLLCERCGGLFINIIEHIMVSCLITKGLRDDMWRDIINIDPIEFSVFVDSIDSLRFAASILAYKTEFELDLNNELSFAELCVRNTEKICKFFYRQ